MKRLLPLLVVPFLSVNLQAGGLVAAQVDARARWVAHIDLEALHASQLYQAILEADEGQGIQAALNQLVETEGVDLFRDVRGATLYGSDADDENAVALLATSTTAEAVIARWEEKIKAQPIDIGGRACRMWSDGDESGYAFLRATPTSTDRLLVMSKSKDALAQALDVLDGKLTSLAKKPSADITGITRPGTIVSLSATEILETIPGLSEAGPDSTIAKMAQGLRVEFGEFDGRFFLDVNVRTERAEDAMRIQQILQGLTALASFAAEDPTTGATIGRWLKALDLSSDGPNMRVRFEYDLKLLIQEARALGITGDEESDEPAEKRVKVQQK